MVKYLKSLKELNNYDLTLIFVCKEWTSLQVLQKCRGSNDPKKEEWTAGTRT